MTDTNFFKSNGVEKVIRYSLDEKFCNIDCDFLELNDALCHRFNSFLWSKNKNNYLERCKECLEFSNKCKK